MLEFTGLTTPDYYRGLYRGMDMTKPTWERAYYVPDKMDRSIDYVLQKRDSGAPIREGDLWSSKAQFERGTGLKLLGVKSNTCRNHFRAWPKEYETDRWKDIARRAGISKNSLSHAYRFHHLFQELLVAMEEDKEVRRVFSILDVMEGPDIGKRNGADIVITHKDGFHRKRTLVSITDKYRKREIEPSDEVFILNIQKWTDENCMNFEKYGKNMAISYWVRHTNRIKEAERAIEEAERAREEAEIVESSLIERKSKVEVNKRKLHGSIQSVFQKIQKDKLGLGAVIRDIDDKINYSNYEELIGLIRGLQKFNAELRNTWITEVNTLKYSNFEKEIKNKDLEYKFRYIEESNLDWMEIANSEPNTIHSLDYYSDNSMDYRPYLQPKHFLSTKDDYYGNDCKTELGIEIINSKTTYSSRRIRYGTIEFVSTHPLYKCDEIINTRLRLVKKSRLAFESEYPEMMRLAEEYKLELKERHEKFLEAELQPLHTQLEQIRAKGTSRSKSDEELAYHLEHSYIPEAEKKKVRRESQLNEPNVEVAIRKFNKQ
jgi:hypothetical protein